MSEEHRPQTTPRARTHGSGPLGRRRLESAWVGLVVLVGLAQPLGELTGIRFLRVLGVGLASSPMPRVFHYQEIAIRMRLETRSADGEVTALELSPETLARVRGPMTRRLPYTLGPFARLPRSVWHPIYAAGLCSGGPLARELGLPTDLRWAVFRIDYRAPVYPEERTLVVQCPR